MAGNTNFPGSLDSHTGGNPYGFAEVANLKYTEATINHTSAVTTVTVTSTTGFASRGIIIVGPEVITYTGTTATTFTGCTRGAGGTTATAFNAGAIVGSAPVAANLNDHSAAIVALETKVGITSSTPTASKVLGADGTGTSSWRQVATTDLAANAVTQVQAATASGGAGGTSTSYATVAGASITMTTTGGPVQLTVHGTTRNSLAMHDTYIGFFVDGSQVGSDIVATASGVNYANSAGGGHVIASLAAGSHTFDIRYKVSAGTATIAVSLGAVEFKR